MTDSNNSHIINVENLTKRFGDFTAVDNISFTVARGEIFGFLGPNGAGKSTTIKMLITLLDSTSGHASIDGHDIRHEAYAVRKTIGYVPQSISVDGTLTAQENMMLMAELYDVPRSERKERIADILKFLKLDAFTNRLVRTFSGGMVRKMEIGQAMLHHPHVLFLDEPTTGLDPIARQDVWEHLLNLREQFGTAIFFSTHYMDEADAAADRLAIMSSGKIAVIGTSQELKEKTGIPGATLEDAFIYFTGNSLQENANFRDLKRTRQTEARRG
jgi:ABC-2 type transport system ATP-binding protein